MIAYSAPFHGSVARQSLAPPEFADLSKGFDPQITGKTPFNDCPLFSINLTPPDLTVIVESVNDLGKVLIIVGLLITTVGILLATGIGKNWLGRLPGDLNWSQGHVSFHFPIMTCLIISAILSLLMWFFRR
jgi:hypothetical protein